MRETSGLRLEPFAVFIANSCGGAASVAGPVLSPPVRRWLASNGTQFVSGPAVRSSQIARGSHPSAASSGFYRILTVVCVFLVMWVL